MTVLIPVTCWKTARKTAMPRGRRSRFSKSSRSVPASCAIVSRISASSRRACSTPPTRSRTARASASRPFSTRKRGDSGTKRSATRKAIEGIAAEANIHRQEEGPPKERSQFTK